MDILLSSTENGIWEVPLSGGKPTIITGDTEKMQQGMVAVYKMLGSTPQLPFDGVDWVNYICGEKNFGELDADIRKNLKKVGDVSLFPDYNIVNNRLDVAVRRR